MSTYREDLRALNVIENRRPLNFISNELKNNREFIIFNADFSLLSTSISNNGLQIRSGSVKYVVHAGGLVGKKS